MLCRATAHRLGPLSESFGSPAEGTSSCVSQYGLALANGRSAAALDDCRSEIAPVTDSFSSAPTCSWDALIVFRILRANQIPAARKTNSLRRFPRAYQLLCTQVVNSFMASPWTGTGSTYNSPPSEETGRKSRKGAGGFLPSQPIRPRVPLHGQCEWGFFLPLFRFPFSNFYFPSNRRIPALFS